METLNNTFEMIHGDIVLLALGVALCIIFPAYRIIKDGKDLVNKVKELNKD